MNTFANNKNKYGEVFTPPSLVQQMIDDLTFCGGGDGADDLSLSQVKSVFEPGAGKGVFFDVFVNKNKCFHEHNHFKYILNEINAEHLEDLQQVCKNHAKHADILLQDCLGLDINMECDLVIGNLPFNCDTKKFVPALAINHKDDKHVTQSKSVTLWTKITHFCFDRVLKTGGYFFAIIPCIWLKPDRSGIYDLFTRDHSIILLKTFDCKTANRLFDYNCQTPICYVLVQKKKTNDNEKENNGGSNVHKKHFKLYDHINAKYTDFRHIYGKCIPTHFVEHFSNHSHYIEQRQISSCYDHVLKISTLNPTCLSGETKRFSKGGLEDYPVDGSGCGSDDEFYKIITGSLFDKKTNKLTLNGFISSVPCLYYGKPKLILPHKRLAKFFKDYDGTYSCFGRDMYVFLCDSENQIDELYDFLNGTDSVIVNQMIESGFTIRMNFIEKYVFQYIPWIFDTKFDYKSYKEFCLCGY